MGPEASDDHFAAQASTACFDEQDLAMLATAASQIEPDQVVQKKLALTPPVKAAGIAVRAADTGRVLMIQRSNDPGDPARGTWEFPGGKLEEGEHPRQAAQREWQEEMGMRLPAGQHAGEWGAGVYRGFVHEIPRERSVRINRQGDDRKVRNPDDPDGDNIEVAAWVHPRQMRWNASVRPELRRSRAWSHVEKAQARAATFRLRVAGVSKHPAGRVYRMETRDGRYVGRTLPSKVRLRKGDAAQVSVTDFTQDAQTDLQWTNPVIASSYVDAPQSWAELQALAGAHLEKEYPAEGAMVAPPAGDQGATQSMSGPTLAAVHVAAPLPDLSDFTLTLPRKIRQRRDQESAQLEGQQESIKGNGDVLVGEFLPIQKADRMKQIIYGVVLEPNVLDSQDDFMLPKHVEATAHGYLKKAIRGKSSVAKLQHRLQGFKRDKPSICPVESFIAPVDFPLEDGQIVKKGSWVMAMHVEDADLWQDFLDGKYQAFSVGGHGVRQSFTRPDQDPLGYIAEPPPGRWGLPRPTPGQLGSFI
jgi:8-oxo-dGTP pyrophosphatase MutT (NUDIX family)